MKAFVNDKFKFELDNNSGVEFDQIRLGNGAFHVIKNNRSFRAQIVSTHADEKRVTILVNNVKYEVKLQDKYDELLKALGMEAGSSKKLKEVKAPMPGLVLDVRVKAGDSVKKGDGLLVLQAMKMENVISSPGDGVVKSIVVKNGDAVEKNQVLINFE